MIFLTDKKGLKKMKASHYKEGDIIKVGKYDIEIKYGEYAKPSLETLVWDREKGLYRGCIPGIGRPYFINNFINS